MTRILLFTATAISLVATGVTADAGSRHKHKHYRHHHGAIYAPGFYGPRPYYGGWQAPVVMSTPGPPWAMPNECYTDEGYGRYSPCDRRR